MKRQRETKQIMNQSSQDNNMEVLLLNTLNSATSQDPQLVKQAEQNLSAWEKEPNFYSTMLQVYSNKHLDPSSIVLICSKCKP